MALITILVFSLVSLLVGWLAPQRLRIWLLLITSILALFWLQPALPIRNLGFWLSILAIILTIMTWTITQPETQTGSASRKIMVAAAVLIVGVVILLTLPRYLGSFCCLTPTRPPPITQVLLFLTTGGILALIPFLFPQARKLLSSILILLILGLFIILKSPTILQYASGWLRDLTGQPVNLAGPQDIIWFGFSFLAFRLLHTLFDFRSGKLPAYRLDEYATYSVFYPALPAGPIDRSQRFITDLRQSRHNPAQDRIQGVQRIFWGLFKKFVLADSLALFALNSQNATQVNSPLWMWLLLYAFALRIYFDFSGYTDVAIGLGMFVGIRLPENFDHPYQKQNLTAFWNSWHITLAQWFRAYYFNPLTRRLRSGNIKIPTELILFISQFTTMLLIGLWHGITWNFAIWGAWHGVGLFIHNRWNNWIKPRASTLEARASLRRTITFGSWLLTFNFVALGWVWFALPTVDLSIDVLRSLFGMAAR